jgi:hypothetical protein
MGKHFFIGGQTRFIFPIQLDNCKVENLNRVCPPMLSFLDFMEW